MLIVKMGKSLLKKIGCKTIILVFIIPPILFIGYFFYYCRFERNYIKLDENKIITVWNNYIIFSRYWYPFYPKNNYIYVDNGIEEFYDIRFTITQDSIIGIWCTQPIRVCSVGDIKDSDEYIGYSERENWERQYDFANVSNIRRDSLSLEFCYQLWYPCSLQKGMYIYRTDMGITQKSFGH